MSPRPLWSRVGAVVRAHALEQCGPGARFSKVPKLYGIFLGVTIPFVSQERRGFESSNYTLLFLFVTLKACQKIGVPKQAVGSFTNGFPGPKSFRDFGETGHWFEDREKL